MKVFISMPMRDLSPQEIMAKRKALSEKIKQQYPTADIVNSIMTQGKPLTALGMSLIELSKCDTSYFAKGWKQARGCKIEHSCCKEYDIQIEYEK